MTFIIFPIFVLIMVIVVVVSYGKMNGIRKELLAMGQRIQSLHQEEVSAINEALIKTDINGYAQTIYLEKLREVIRTIESEPARNAGRALYYHQLLQSALVGLPSNAGVSQQEAKLNYFNKASPERKQLENNISASVVQYNALAIRFSKSLEKFPNNLLAAMAGFSPFEQLSA